MPGTRPTAARRHARQIHGAELHAEGARRRFLLTRQPDAYSRAVAKLTGWQRIQWQAARVSRKERPRSGFRGAVSRHGEVSLIMRIIAAYDE